MNKAFPVVDSTRTVSIETNTLPYSMLYADIPDNALTLLFINTENVCWSITLFLKKSLAVSYPAIPYSAEKLLPSDVM